MKKNKIKLLSVFLSSLTVFSNTFPVFAYNTDEYNNSIEEISYQNSEDEDFSNTTSVFAQIGSEYKVTIPKTVVLNGELKSATYKVKTEGDIAGDEYIEVTPDEFFNLYTKNKDPQIANIYQDKTIWTVDEFDILADGYINSPTITAGKWKGTFNFYISLNNSRVLGDIILPPNLDDDYRLKISKIKDNPGIYDDGGVLILPWPEIETRTEGGETIPEIINSTPGGTGLSIPEGTTKIPENYIKGTNINIIYIPPTVRDIGPHFADGTNINIICLGPITNTTPETFDGLPGDTQVYIGGKPVGPDINIDIETLPESLEEIKDENAIILEKGCIYQITALYNFINDVTKKSTIKSSNPDIVKFIPDCTLEALEVGTSIISGQYNGPNGLKNAYILVKVIDTGYSSGVRDTSGHRHTVSQLQYENRISATCTENGKVDWVFYCTDCGKELGRRTVIENKIGHKYKITSSKKVSCEENGYATYVCTNCGDSYTTTTPAVGHSYSVQTIAATCTKNGSKISTCKNCGDVKTETIKATGHDYTWKIITQKPLSKEGTCKKCGDKIQYAEVIHY